MLMFARMLLSWFPFDEDSAIVSFVYTMTEPIIFPVRAILESFDLFKSLPIDLSFFIAFLLISILRLLLPSVI